MMIERVWAMPSASTFSIKPIAELLRGEVDCGEKWVDPFSNGSRIASVTNDINPDVDADYHVDALEFLRMFGDESVDGVLYDPPYSPRQVSECYKGHGYEVTTETTQASFWSAHKAEIGRIVRRGGKVITFGWNSGGAGKDNGFKVDRILLVAHGGWHNDTIVTVCRKEAGRQLELWEDA